MSTASWVALIGTDDGTLRCEKGKFELSQVMKLLIGATKTGEHGICKDSRFAIQELALAPTLRSGEVGGWAGSG